MGAIFDQIEKISRKKSNLIEVEKKLKFKMREKEKKRRIKLSIEIGKLACKADIDSLDNNILLGAFLEIAERSKDPKIIQKWQSLSEQFESSQKNVDIKSLSIRFSSDIDSDLKKKLKDLDFVWNKFRKEFYGHAEKRTLDSLLNGLDYVIEELE